MRTVVAAVAAVAVVVLSTGLAVAKPAATAAAAPSASAVLTGIDGAYANVKSAKVEFTQTTVDKVFGTSAQSGGVISVSRPKLKWTYISKADKITKVFIANSTKLIYVDHLNKQYAVTKLAKADLPVALSWLTGKGKLAKSFSPVITASTATTIDLELTPLAPSASFSKINLVVDAKTYQVKESVVTATNGNTSGYVFKNLDVAAKPADSEFEYRLGSKANQGYKKIVLDAGGPATTPSP